MESFNAQYLGGSVGLTLGDHGVLMGARLTKVNPVGTLVVATRWAISVGTVK
jgi:hypothetical protein